MCSRWCQNEWNEKENLLLEKFQPPRRMSLSPDSLLLSLSPWVHATHITTYYIPLLIFSSSPPLPLLLFSHLSSYFLSFFSEMNSPAPSVNCLTNLSYCKGYRERHTSIQLPHFLTSKYPRDISLHFSAVDITFWWLFLIPTMGQKADHRG